MKKAISILLMILIMTSCVSVFAQSEVKVTLDGNEILFPDVKPFIDERDRVLVPIRFVSEALDALVDWENESRTAVVKQGNDEIRYTVYQPMAYLNGEMMVMDTYGILKDGRTLVPIRFISELLGYTVIWDEKTSTVIITSPKDVVEFPEPEISVNYPKSISDKRLGLGVLFICISMIALQIGVKKADSPSLIAIIFSSNSILTILFVMLLLKEKLTKNKIVALVFGTVGVLACADFSSGTGLESVMYGVFAALSFSLYTALSQKYMKKFGGIVQTSIVFLTGSIVLLLSLLVMGVDLTPTFTPYTIANLCYLGFFVTGVGYVCYFKAIEKGGAIMASLAFFIKPILTPFVTFFINGVVPDFKVFIAVACIVIASYFATYKRVINKD